MENSNPIFLDGDQQIVKVAILVCSKFDIVKLDTGEIAKIVKYPSNASITVELEDGKCKVISKENILEVITKYKN